MKDRPLRVSDIEGFLNLIKLQGGLRYEPTLSDFLHYIQANDVSRAKKGEK